MVQEMASLNGKPNKETCLMFKAKTPHFFKIILDNTLREGKLAIPRKFVREYGSDVSSSVHLKVPSGAVWQVEVIKCDNDVWLGNGWQEFVEYYSLAHGYLLVFEHDKNYGFNVLIFDLSASEIDYPYSSINDGLKELNLEKEIRKPKMEMAEEDDVSLEILDESSQNLKRNARQPPGGCPRPRKTMRTYYAGGRKLESTSKFLCPVTSISRQHGGDAPENPAGNVNPQDSESARQTEENGSGECIGSKKGKSNGVMGVMARTKRLTRSEKDDAFKRASATFKSENPFFLVAMQPTYLVDGRLGIPVSFVTKYFGKQCGNCILKTLDGRSWTVQFYNVRKKGRSYAKISSGWKAFAQDNLLEVGDVCVFELMKGAEISLKVVFFRGAQDANHSQSIDKGGDEGGSSSKGMKPMIENEKNDALKRASADFDSKNPSFMVFMRPSYIHPRCSMAIPSSFARKYLWKKCCNANLCGLDGKTWPVKICKMRGTSNARITSGWRAFMQGNHLEVGDVCAFEMIDSTTISFKVVIFKALQDVNCSAH